jgi:hypothetical protein
MSLFIVLVKSGEKQIFNLFCIVHRRDITDRTAEIKARKYAYISLVLGPSYQNWEIVFS